MRAGSSPDSPSPTRAPSLWLLVLHWCAEPRTGSGTASTLAPSPPTRPGRSSSGSSGRPSARAGRRAPASPRSRGRGVNGPRSTTGVSTVFSPNATKIFAPHGSTGWSTPSVFGVSSVPHAGRVPGQRAARGRRRAPGTSRSRWRRPVAAAPRRAAVTESSREATARATITTASSGGREHGELALGKYRAHSAAASERRRRRRECACTPPPRRTARRRRRRAEGSHARARLARRPASRCSAGTSSPGSDRGVGATAGRACERQTASSTAPQDPAARRAIATITAGRRSAYPAPTPSRIRKPASSANLGAKARGMRRSLDSGPSGRTLHARCVRRPLFDHGLDARARAAVSPAPPMGAPVIGSTPAWFLGNATMSRRFGSPASTITIRSIPNANPPCGGAPIPSASSRKPNFARCSSALSARTSKTLRLQLRLVDPDRAAADLVAVRDEVVGWRDARRRVGVEQLLALRGRARERDGASHVHRPSSSSHSNIGKSITQSELVRGLVDQAELAPEVRAQRAEHARDRLRLAGAEEDGRAGLARRERGELGAPRGTSRSASAPRRPRRRRGRRAPLPPTPSRSSSSAASSARENSRGTVRKRTPRASAKTPNSEPRVTSVASSISRPKRRSGLSVPYRAIASA